MNTKPVNNNPVSINNTVTIRNIKNENYEHIHGNNNNNNNNINDNNNNINNNFNNNNNNNMKNGENNNIKNSNTIENFRLTKNSNLRNHRSVVALDTSNPNYKKMSPARNNISTISKFYTKSKIFLTNKKKNNLLATADPCNYSSKIFDINKDVSFV